MLRAGNAWGKPPCTYTVMNVVLTQWCNPGSHHSSQLGVWVKWVSTQCYIPGLWPLCLLSYLYIFLSCICICNLDHELSNQLRTLVVLSLLLCSGLLPVLLLLFVHWWVIWPCNNTLSDSLPFTWYVAFAWCSRVGSMQSVLPILQYFDWIWRWEEMLMPKNTVNAWCNSCNDCWAVV